MSVNVPRFRVDIFQILFRVHVMYILYLCKVYHGFFVFVNVFYFFYRLVCPLGTPVEFGFYYLFYLKVTLEKYGLFSFFYAVFSTVTLF